MNTVNNPASTRFALLVMIYCWLPHLASTPYWLSSFALFIIVYCLLATGYSLPLPNSRIRLLISITALIVLFWLRNGPWSGQFFIHFLLLFVALKNLEIRSLRDLYILILCNFYLILTAILINQELWIFLYMSLALLANLVLMVKVTAPLVDFKLAFKIAIKHVLLAIPISLALFYLFPRLTNPLWHVPAMSENHIGFSEEMTLDKMSELFQDDSKVMRITFKPTFLPSLYWRGLVLSHYDGRRWLPTISDKRDFSVLQAIDAYQQADYQILLEPHQKKWLFYQDRPIAANPTLLYSEEQGLIQPGNQIVYQRILYSVIDKKSASPTLSIADRKRYTHLPYQSNPRIAAWSKQQLLAAYNNPDVLVKNVSQYIHQQSFWYSLTPPKITGVSNQMDFFWFDSRRGYCEYYASAVTVILRSAGIPARIIIGYHGGLWNPLSKYLTVRQNDAHAWLEYWVDGNGWQRFDPTQFIAAERIDSRIQEQQANRFDQSWFSEWNNGSQHLPWLTRLNLFIDSAQFFWEQWLLFYNYDTQRTFLRQLGFEDWDSKALLQASIILLIIFLLSGSLWYQYRHFKKREPLSIEHLRLQKEMKRLGVSVTPPATLARQLHHLIHQLPSHQSQLICFQRRYEQLRLQRFSRNKRHYQATVKVIKSLRQFLQKIK